MKLAVAYLSCDKAAVFMNAINLTHRVTGLYAAGAMELVSQLRNHLLQRLGLVRWRHLGGTTMASLCCRDYELHYSVLSS
jgi:hypothetical protein